MEISNESTHRKSMFYRTFLLLQFSSKTQNKKNETRASLHDQLNSLRSCLELNSEYGKHGIHKSPHEKKTKPWNCPNPPINKHMFIRVSCLNKNWGCFCLWIGNLFLVWLLFFDGSFTLHQTSFCIRPSGQKWSKDYMRAFGATFETVWKATQKKTCLNKLMCFWW